MERVVLTDFDLEADTSESLQVLSDQCLISHWQTQGLGNYKRLSVDFRGFHQTLEIRLFVRCVLVYYE